MGWTKTIEHTDTCTHTHTLTEVLITDFTEKVTKLLISANPGVHPVCIGTVELEIACENPKTHLLRGQAPPKWQVLVEAPGVHHRRRPLDLTKMTQNRCNKY